MFPFLYKILIEKIHDKWLLKNQFQSCKNEKSMFYISSHLLASPKQNDLTFGRHRGTTVIESSE